MLIELVCTALGLFVIALLVRIVLSWFPVEPGGAVASIYNVLYTITEPVLGPLRRVLPAVGPIDLSPIVVFIGVRIIQASLGCGGVF